jgi:hypothetical protein
MIEAIFELIFSFVGEFILELVLEALVELGFHGAAEKISNKARNRFFVGAVYAVFGGVLGFVSLLVFPKIEFGSAVLPALYFFVSPVLAGFSLSFVSYLINRGIRPVSWFEWDKFIFGVFFAIAYSVARVLFG